MSKLENISIELKANIYFGGKVVSHTIFMADGSKKSVGIIYSGDYSFNTAAPERMDIISGTCKVKIAGQTEWTTYAAGSGFDVPANSSFEITVAEGQAEYLCAYL